MGEEQHVALRAGSWEDVWILQRLCQGTSGQECLAAQGAEVRGQAFRTGSHILGFLGI